MRKVELARVRPILGWVAWLMLLGLLAVVVWRPDALATAGLFQSDLPTPTQLPTATSPVETPVPTATTLSVTPTSVVTQPLPTATWTALPEPTPEPTPMPSPIPTAVLEPVSAPSPEPAGDEEPRYPEEQANLRFSWRALIDSLALGISYVWLACGLALLVLVVAVLLWAWLRGRRRSAGGR